MKKLFSLLLALTLALTLAAPAAAEGENMLDYITDDVGILSQSEWTALETTARSLAQQHNCGLYVLIVDDYSDFGDTIEGAIDGIYKNYNLGNETGGNAVVMMLSLSDRQYYICDYGDYGEKVLTSSGITLLEKAMQDNFAENDWNGGISDYLKQGEDLLKTAVSTSAASGEKASMGARALKAYGIAFVVAVIVSFIVCGAFKAQMKTAVKAVSAKEYISPMGVDMYIREDSYTHTTRKERKIESNSGGDGKSGAGGSF